MFLRAALPGLGSAGAGPDFQRGEGLGVQERAVAAVRIAAKVQPGCWEIGGEAKHLDAGGDGSLPGF